MIVAGLFQLKLVADLLNFDLDSLLVFQRDFFFFFNLLPIFVTGETRL